MAAATASPPLVNELDVMLSDLSKGHYNDYSVCYSDFGSFSEAPPPARPPPPKGEYNRKTASEASTTVGSLKVPRRPPPPPKLQHVLKEKSHDLVKATPR